MVQKYFLCHRKLWCLYRGNTRGLEFGLEKKSSVKKWKLVKARAWWLICDQLKIVITHSFHTCTAHIVHKQGKTLWRSPTFKCQNPLIYLEIICWNRKTTLQDTAMNHTLLQSYSSVNHAFSTLGMCTRRATVTHSHQFILKSHYLVLKCCISRNCFKILLKVSIWIFSKVLDSWH